MMCGETPANDDDSQRAAANLAPGSRHLAPGSWREIAARKLVAGDEGISHEMVLCLFQGARCSSPARHGRARKEPDEPDHLAGAVVGAHAVALAPASRESAASFRQGPRRARDAAGNGARVPVARGRVGAVVALARSGARVLG